MAEEKIILPEDDDWLADFQDDKTNEPQLEALDQSDVDILLDSEVNAEAAAPEENEIPAIDLASLDQSQVDELLGSSIEEEAPPVATSPDQDEIDQLFDEASREEVQAAATPKTAGSSADQDTFDLDFETIEADDFGFDDEIAEIPEEEEPVALSQKEPVKKEKKKPARAIPFFTKKNLAVAASVVGLLGAGTLGYMMFGGKKQPAILPPQPPKVVVQKKRPANQAPEAFASQYNMQGKGSEVLMMLSGRDADGDPLQYAISKTPKYGTLTGKLPAVTYLPDQNFPGRDVFEFTVNDGKASSPPVAVIITGPDMTVKQAKKIKTHRPRVAAVNVSMKTLSTEELLIDWKKIWKQSNSAPFTGNVRVSIEKQPTHGKLIEQDNALHLYEPEQLYSGNDFIHYRFEKDGIKSKVRQLKLLIARGDLPPKVLLRPLANRNYMAGETVVLDASGSEDDTRSFLEFNWQQLAGTPVRFKKINEEGSVVSFIVPSSFYTAGTGDLRFRVTVVDRLDQLHSEDIEIKTHSRRQTALWRGQKKGGLAPEPVCPQGECPGAYLPWPFVEQ